MGDGFKEHGLMLYLSPELYFGFIQIQADKKLGRSYAGLLTFVEGLHSLGYLKDGDYEFFKNKYSQGPVESDKPLTLEQLQTKTEQDKMAKTFSRVLDQWTLHPDAKWRDHWIREATAWKDKIPNAKMVLDLAEGSS